MHAHIIQHETFEAPGAILKWVEKRNYTVTFSKVYLGDSMPKNIGNIDLLIVLGGPQSPQTTKEECPHFDARAEIDFIQQGIRSGTAVFGICLGAQLIGEALGAQVERSFEKEIGVFPIRLTEEGLIDLKVEHFGSSLFVGHWHSDMPGLTAGSKVLATSIGCPRQIVAYSDLVYGFQCHMELTPDVVELLIAEDEDVLTNNIADQFVQDPDEIRTYDFTEMNDKLFRFLDKLVSAYKQKKKS